MKGLILLSKTFSCTRKCGNTFCSNISSDLRISKQYLIKLKKISKNREKYGFSRVKNISYWNEQEVFSNNFTLVTLLKIHRLPL